MNELIEFPLVDTSQSIKAGTADYLLLESFAEVGALFVPNQDVDLVDCAEGVQEFLKHDLANEASRAGHKHSLSCVFGHYRHCYIVRNLISTNQAFFKVAQMARRKGQKEKHWSCWKALDL